MQIDDSIFMIGDNERLQTLLKHKETEINDIKKVFKQNDDILEQLLGFDCSSFTG